MGNLNLKSKLNLQSIMQNLSFNQNQCYSLKISNDQKEIFEDSQHHNQNIKLSTHDMDTFDSLSINTANDKKNISQMRSKINIFSNSSIPSSQNLKTPLIMKHNKIRNLSATQKSNNSILTPKEFKDYEKI